MSESGEAIQAQGVAVLTRLRQDIKAAESEASEIQGWLSHLRGLEAGLAAYLGDDESQEQVRQVEASVTAAVGADDAPLSLRGMSQADAAAAVLGHCGTPMTTMQIVDAMLAGGHEAAGPEEGRRERLGASLFSLMRRRTKRFIKSGPGRWSLVKPTGEASS